MLHIQTNGKTYQIATADQLIHWVSLATAPARVMAAFLKTLEVVTRQSHAA